ncbi:unnamed protein product [Fusarium fujikuroi]|nr:unnamed protein product [Fusarium fujikuroi]
MHRRREAVRGFEIKPAALKQQNGNATLSKAEGSKSKPGEHAMLRFPRYSEATLAYLYCSLPSRGLRQLQNARLVMVKKRKLCFWLSNFVGIRHMLIREEGNASN